MEIRVVEEKGRAQIEVTILSGPDDPRVSGIVRQTELEDALKDTAFVRTSRQELVNLDQVTGIKPAGSGRMLLSLVEKTLVASRKYAAEIKRRIGIV